MNTKIALLSIVLLISACKNDDVGASQDNNNLNVKTCSALASGIYHIEYTKVSGTCDQPVSRDLFFPNQGVVDSCNVVSGLQDNCTLYSVVSCNDHPEDKYSLRARETMAISINEDGSFTGTMTKLIEHTEVRVSPINPNDTHEVTMWDCDGKYTFTATLK